MMLRHYFGRGLVQKRLGTIGGAFIRRSFKNASDFPFLPGIPGGGLEKLQGGIKEEKYFNTHDRELISRLQKAGTELKCENCLENWTEFEKVLETSVEPTSLQNTCSMNKHRNCMEEAFFLNEQADCLKMLQIQSKNDTSNLNASNENTNVGSSNSSSGGSTNNI